MSDDEIRRENHFIYVLVAILVVIVGVWLLYDARSEPKSKRTQFDLYEGTPFDAHLVGLDKRALEQAYQERLVKLFGVWLTGTQATDATNFRNGLQIARRGYNAALQQIELREQQFQQLQDQQKK
jgi:hypothetical protein